MLLLGAVGDDAVSWIVGRHAHLDPVSEHDADEVLPHLPANPRLDIHPLVELDGEQPAGMHVGNYAFNFDEIVSSQGLLLMQWPRGEAGPRKNA